MARNRGIAWTVAGALLLGVLASGSGAAAQSWREETLTRRHTGEETLDVEVRYGFGRFGVSSAEPGVLYRVDLRYDEEATEPVVEYEEGRLRVASRERNGHGGFPFRRNRRGGSLDVALPRDVDLDLGMELGAVRADVDLGGLRLRSLSIATGAAESRIDVSEANPVGLRRARIQAGAADFTALRLGNLNADRISVEAGVGEVTLDFTGRWRTDADVSVDMGLGALHLRFPEGLGVRLEKESFLVSLDPQGLIRRGDAYLSPDWDEAERRVTVRIEAAVGSVDVEWVP